MPLPEQCWLHTSEDGPLDLTLDRCCDAARTDTTDETAEDESPAEEDGAC